MTSPVDEIEVECPNCATVFRTWYRASMDLTLDAFDDVYIKAATVKTCANCGYQIALGALIIRRRGVWELRAPRL